MDYASRVPARDGGSRHDAGADTGVSRAEAGLPCRQPGRGRQRRVARRRLPVRGIPLVFERHHAAEILEHSHVRTLRKAMKKNVAASTSAPRAILPAVNDPIRIVPLHVPHELFEAAPGIEAAPPPQLSYRNGPLLANVEIFTIFWGTA